MIRSLPKATIEFHGQVIFAVVAETREIARRAARLAKIEVAATTPAVTVEDALAMGTKDVVPEYAFTHGDVGKALKAAPHVISESFHVGGQEHFYIEGQVALAMPEEKGGMTVYSSTQHPTEVQHCIAKMLKVPDAMVTCECRRMGGAFGGKESQAAQWAALAALAAHVTGRPAKCRLDRDQDMIMTGKRHDFRIDYKIGYDDTARLTAVDVDFLARCGYSADLSQGVCDRTMFHADNAYFYPAYHIKSRRLRTNTVSNTAFRGFGGPQGMMFAERVMDAIAVETGLDPLDVRKRNLYGRGRDVTPYRQKIEDNIALEVIEALEKSSSYRITAEEDRCVQQEEHGSEKRHCAHAGQVRHFVYAHPSQPGGRPCPCLYGWLGASQSWRHGNGAGALYQGRAGRGGSVRHFGGRGCASRPRPPARFPTPRQRRRHRARI